MGNANGCRRQDEAGGDDPAPLDAVTGGVDRKLRRQRLGAAESNQPEAADGGLLAAAIILLPTTTAGFDIVWIGVILTINMEVGLITPPVGLNLYIINGIAPDLPLSWAEGGDGGEGLSWRPFRAFG